MESGDAAEFDVTRLWGKLGRPKEERPGFHPLICHMLDVSAVVRAMWDTVLSDAAKYALTAGLGMKDLAAARDWVVFLGGVHDLGKCSAAFVFRREAAVLAPLYRDLPAWHGSAADAHHGIVTARELPDLLVSRFGVTKPVAQRLALVTGGHHGLFPSGDRMRELKGDAIGRGPWQPQRAAVLAAFTSVCAPPVGTVPRQIDNATAMKLAGLISVADWIGSDEDEFTYAFDRSDGTLSLDLSVYAQRAAGKAERALAKHGWAGWQQQEQPRAFETLFPQIVAPRPVQEAVVALAEEMAPGIVVIESPMGEGKTEAALYLADRWGTKPGPRGLYVALPTQATTNQMFSRVCDFLTTRYPAERVNIQLIHGHAALSAEYELLRREGERLFTPRDVDPEDAAAGVGAAAWFAGSKRGLLAAFGVGTVDQGLLAVLHTKHVFVRHFGLAHRVVVIDEVHAYDTYMSALIERLLEWLAALGSPVVLLSATLPAERRRALLNAYARGLGVTAAHEEAAGYPRITALSGAATGLPATVRVRHVPPSARSRRVVSVRWRTEAALDTAAGRDALGAALLERLADGGCAAVICNTVARAQAVYRALAPLFPGTASDGEPVLDLLHARFVFAERQQREERALRRFGRPGVGVVRPERAVLVATQVIEQSLDVDFDLLVTDLAPADLVLQRAGRLHRHARPRPASLEEPEVWVCAPPAPDGAPAFGRGDTYVYEEHVLLRSWLALKDRATLTLPDEIEELVEDVYGERGCPVDAGAAIEAQWATTLATMQAGREHERWEARTRWLQQPHADVKLWEFTRDPKEEDSPEFHEAHRALTRLAEPSVQVILLHRTAAGLALDAEGRETVNSSTRPNVATARRLLERAVTLTDRRIVHALLSDDVPTGWQRSTVLQHSRLVELDAAGEELTKRRWKLRNDPDVGVEVVSHAPDALSGAIAD